MARALIALAALALAAGAASAQGPRRADPAPSIAVEALAPQTLVKGKCGLFLWTRTADPQFVFVAFDTPAEARMRVSGRNVTFERVAFDGLPRAGHFERQTFQAGDLSIEAEIDWDDVRPVRDGALVRQGTVRLRAASGWETLMPVAGLSACQR
jgi:hypothetical protein